MRQLLKFGACIALFAFWGPALAAPDETETALVVRPKQELAGHGEDELRRQALSAWLRMDEGTRLQRATDGLAAVNEARVRLGQGASEKILGHARKGVLEALPPRALDMFLLVSRQDPSAAVRAKSMELVGSLAQGTLPAPPDHYKNPKEKEAPRPETPVLDPRSLQVLILGVFDVDPTVRGNALRQLYELTYYESRLSRGEVRHVFGAMAEGLAQSDPHTVVRPFVEVVLADYKFGRAPIGGGPDSGWYPVLKAAQENDGFSDPEVGFTLLSVVAGHAHGATQFEAVLPVMLGFHADPRVSVEAKIKFWKSWLSRSKPGTLRAFLSTRLGELPGLHAIVSAFDELAAGDKLQTKFMDIRLRAEVRTLAQKEFLERQEYREHCARLAAFRSAEDPVVRAVGGMGLERLFFGEQQVAQQPGRDPGRLDAVYRDYVETLLDPVDSVGLALHQHLTAYGGSQTEGLARYLMDPAQDAWFRKTADRPLQARRALAKVMEAGLGRIRDENETWNKARSGFFVKIAADDPQYVPEVLRFLSKRAIDSGAGREAVRVLRNPALPPEQRRELLDFFGFSGGHRLREISDPEVLLELGRTAWAVAKEFEQSDPVLSTSGLRVVFALPEEVALRLKREVGPLKEPAPRKPAPAPRIAEAEIPEAPPAAVPPRGFRFCGFQELASRLRTWNPLGRRKP